MSLCESSKKVKLLMEDVRRNMNEELCFISGPLVPFRH